MGYFRKTRQAPPTRRLRQLLLALSLGLSVAVVLWQMVLMTRTDDELPRRRAGGIVQVDSRIYFAEPDDEESDAAAAADSAKRADAEPEPDADAANRESAMREKQRVDALLAAQGKPLNTLPRKRRKQQAARAARVRATTARPGVRVLHAALPQRPAHENVCSLYEHLDLPASNESGPQYTYRYRQVRVIRAPDAQHLCDKDTQVFAGINSGVFNFERRNAVRVRVGPNPNPML